MWVALFVCSFRNIVLWNFSFVIPLGFWACAKYAVITAEIVASARPNATIFIKSVLWTRVTGIFWVMILTVFSASCQTQKFENKIYDELVEASDVFHELVKYLWKKGTMFSLTIDLNRLPNWQCGVGADVPSSYCVVKVGIFEVAFSHWYPV